MKNIISANPFQCRMWSLHDRIDCHINEKTCKAEIDSIAKHGQLVPTLGRLLHRDPNYKIELIFGARRLFVARHLNKPILVDLREMSDRDAIAAMDIENRHRKDLSAYERGLSYAKWLREGHFRSQEEIARALKLSASQVSRMLKISQLPAAITGAFNSPVELHESWALCLVEALDDPHRRQATLREAREIADMSPRPAAAEVYRRLLAASAKGRKVAKKSHDEIVKGPNGMPLFRIKQTSRSICLVLPTQTVSHKALANIKSTLVHLLRGGDEAAASGEQRRPVKDSRHPSSLQLAERSATTRLDSAAETQASSVQSLFSQGLRSSMEP
jgi:ParB/RepB/Spo0J family partition protein